MDNLGIVYTPVSNLKKTQSMEVGQVLPQRCAPARFTLPCMLLPVSRSHVMLHLLNLRLNTAVTSRRVHGHGSRCFVHDASPLSGDSNAGWLTGLLSISGAVPAVHQVGFKDQKLIRRLKVETRLNAVVNRLNGTKREEYPDLAAEREAYDKEASATT